MSNIRRSMMAASRSGSAIDWESIARGMLDASVPFELPADIAVNPTQYAFFGRILMTGHATIANGMTSIGYGAFQDCYALEGVTIPNSVTSLNNNSFQNCKAITTITLPSSVTSIGNNSFSGCVALTSINIPNGVTTINSYVFQNTSALESITIPNTVTSFDAAAFARCGLKSITIPSSVTTFGAGVFQYSIKLKEVVMEATTPPTAGANIFLNCSALNAIYVPDASVSAYQAANNWSTYASKIKGISERPTT